MSTSNEWTDPEVDEPEAVDDNLLRTEDTAADDSQDFDDTADAAPGDVRLGLSEAEAEVLANLLSGAASTEGVADLAPPDLADLIDPAIPAETVPLLDASGNTPADFDTLYQALRQWEAAAADAPLDPRFTPKPTTKPRGDLLMLDRGPFKPVVWLDRATMTPVKYAGEKPQSPTEDFSLPTDSAGRVGAADRAQSALGMTRPVVLIDLHDRGGHIRAELDAFSDRMTAIGDRTAQAAVDHYDWVCWTEERAINGDW